MKKQYLYHYSVFRQYGFASAAIIIPFPVDSVDRYGDFVQLIIDKRGEEIVLINYQLICSGRKIK